MKAAERIMQMVSMIGCRDAVKSIQGAKYEQAVSPWRDLITKNARNQGIPIEVAYANIAAVLRGNHLDLATAALIDEYEARTMVSMIGCRDAVKSIQGAKYEQAVSPWRDFITKNARNQGIPIEVAYANIAAVLRGNHLDLATAALIDEYEARTKA